MPSAPRRRRLLTLLVAPLAITVLAVGTMGAAPSAERRSRTRPSADATVADLQAYWASTMPDVYGQAYEAIPADRLFPYSASNPPPGCGTRGDTPYAQVAGNAFYCSVGDFVAWDTQELFPRLTEQFGAFAPALVLAHEWGHAVQARVGFDTYQTVYLEQQADCFAGAWAAHVAVGRLRALACRPTTSTRALAGMLQLSDPVGVDGGAGRRARQRLRPRRARSRTASRTARPRAPATRPTRPTVTESGFTSQADYASGGDMALDDLVPALTDALDAYWSAGGGLGADARRSWCPRPGRHACDGRPTAVCSSTRSCTARRTNTIVYDPATLREAHSSVGDFAAGLLVAAEWSSAVQHDLGSPIDGRRRRGARRVHRRRVHRQPGRHRRSRSATASRCRPVTSTR